MTVKRPSVVIDWRPFKGLCVSSVIKCSASFYYAGEDI